MNLLSCLHVVRHVARKSHYSSALYNIVTLNSHLVININVLLG